MLTGNARRRKQRRAEPELHPLLLLLVMEALSRTKFYEGTSPPNSEILSSSSLFSEMFNSSLSNEIIPILQGV